MRKKIIPSEGNKTIVQKPARLAGFCMVAACLLTL
jgi:hypothetical protein